MIGSVLAGRYVLNGFLSDGPIFAQYSAKDKLVGRDLSLRMLKPPFDKEEGFKQALVTAVQKVSQIQSPSVEKLFEIEEEDDHAYLVGELTRAPSLADRIRKLAPFTSSVAVTAAIGVVRGLDAFHKAGLAHGDVSGENVAMLADGDTRLQLGGIWEAYPASQTAGSIVLPSLAPYLAPEVSTGGLPSPSSDLYSVGVLLFELLTGRKPYQADTAIATAMKHATEPIPRVRTLNSSVPAVLDEIVYKAMAKDPISRYASASELLFDLRQVQDAVRFGRTLSWPIRSQSAPTHSPSPQPVAPRMSAVRDRVDPEESSRRSKDERDVPVWMLVMFTAVLSMFLVLIGFLVFFNVTKPRMVVVPSVVGRTLPEARTELARSHLSVRLGQTLSSETVKSDLIISSQPAQGMKVSENSTVLVTVSSGSNHVKVPDLKGLFPDKAAEYLASLHLVLASEKKHEYVEGAKVGRIIKQFPTPGTQALKDSEVQVTINQPSSDTPSTSNAQSETNSYDVNVPLDALTESAVVRIDVVDDDGPKTIFTDRRDPGDPPIDTTVEAKGAQVTFNIYFDDRLVNSFTKKASDAKP